MNRPDASIATLLLLLPTMLFASVQPAPSPELTAFLQRSGYRIEANASIRRLSDNAVAPRERLISQAGLDLNEDGAFVDAKTGAPVGTTALPARLAALFPREGIEQDAQETRTPLSAVSLTKFKASLAHTVSRAPTVPDADQQRERWDLAGPISSRQTLTVDPREPRPNALLAATPATREASTERSESLSVATTAKEASSGPLPRFVGERRHDDFAPAADFVPEPRNSVRLNVRREDEHSYKIVVSQTLSIRLTPITATSFRLQAQLADEKPSPIPEFMIVTPDERRATVAVAFDEDASGKAATLKTTGMEIRIESPDGKLVSVSVSTLSPKKRIIERWELVPEKRQARLLLGKDEHVYGFGDKRAAMDQRGNEIEILNHDATYSGDNDSYKSIPFFFTSAGYGFFFHNLFKSNFDVGASQTDWLSLDATGGPMDFYIFLGDPKSVLSQYTELTGRPAMLPYWSFGYHQGKAAYKGSEALDVARKMREKKLPLDAIYYDDWISEAMRKPFVDELARQGVRLTAGGNPFVVKDEDPELLREMAERGFLMVDAQGKPVIEAAEEMGNPIDRVGYIDWFNPKAVEFYLERKWKAALKSGVFLGMADFGELDNIVDGDKKFWPSIKGLSVEETRNIFGLVYPTALVEAVQRIVGGRTTGMVRAGFAGSQRAGWTTTADSEANFKQMREHVRALINLTLTGFSNVGYDIGGWEKKGPDDVYIRWFAAGAFNPFMWSHGQGDHEPYSHGPEVEAAARKFLELRYRLIPYFYSLGEAAHRTGVPIQRSFPLQEPGDPRSSRVDDEFFVGDHLLIAPVMDKDGRKVYLPKGTWYDFFGEERMVQGPQEIERAKVAFDRIPAYARAGAVIPMGPVMQHTGEKAVDPLTVHYFAFPKEELATGPKTAEFSLYEDDGRSTDFEKGRYERTRLVFVQSARRLSFHVEIRSGDGRYHAVPGRRFALVLHGLAVRRAVVNGKKAAIEKDPATGQPSLRIPSSKATVEIEF